MWGTISGISQTREGRSSRARLILGEPERNRGNTETLVAIGRCWELLLRRLKRRMMLLLIMTKALNNERSKRTRWETRELRAL
jgi:hypothetical protein